MLYAFILTAIGFTVAADGYIQMDKYSTSVSSSRGMESPVSQFHGEKDSCPERPKCDPNAKYRTMDGSCNNLKNPLWGAANRPYARAVPARYADGVHAFPVSASGKALPQARTISRLFMPILPIEDTELTLFFMQWGQIIAHDMSHAKGTDTEKGGTCCSAEKGVLQKSDKGEPCQPPTISKDDPLYLKHKQTCFDVARTSTDAYLGCPNGKSANPVSEVTGWLDGSIVYGQSDARMQELRQMQAGLLRVDMKARQEWPPNEGNTSDNCASNTQPVCYRTGDVRMNQNPGLAMLQIVLLREHNRLARGLLSVNPGWEDERLFQEARRILIAQLQHISYYEWIPVLFHGWNELQNMTYDSNADPSILNEYAHAALRHLHTAIRGKLQLVSEERRREGSILLPEHMSNVAILEANGKFDELLRGHATQPAQAPDRYHDKEVKEDMFRNPITSRDGQDLKTLDMFRGRDHGLGSYNDVRAWCGFPRATTFSDFIPTIPAWLVALLRVVYEDVEDVELTVGGMLEVGKGLGPTFTCIVKDQLRRTRAADRFFYEFSDQPAPFTPNQLKEIRKSNLARLICEHGHKITQMQPQAFKLVSKSNELARCDNYTAIPQLDLQHWQNAG